MGSENCDHWTSVRQTVADPEFARGSANPWGGRQPIIWPIVHENCMKMKKFWPRFGMRVPGAPSQICQWYESYSELHEFLFSWISLIQNQWN